MEGFSERELAGKLCRFRQVWQRVEAAKTPQGPPGRNGVELMPRRNRCQNRRGTGRR